MDKFFVVCTPYADLRKEPVAPHESFGHDDLQETQLLYNEPLIRRHEREGWYYVEALEQKRSSPDSAWHGYPGWVEKKNVTSVERLSPYNLIVKNKTATIFSYTEKGMTPVFVVSAGTHFVAKRRMSRHKDYQCIGLTDGNEGWIKKEDVQEKLPGPLKENIRESIAQTSMLFLGLPYLWGGRSTLTGVDCSGLTNLVYRIHNIQIPRNACDQKGAAKEIDSTHLRKADLIFVSAEDSFDTITHVMLYLEEDAFIEASETGSVVKVTTFKEKFGLTLARLSKKDFVTEKKKISFGTAIE